jgi:hypothetical protein
LYSMGIPPCADDLFGCAGIMGGARFRAFCAYGPERLLPLQPSLLANPLARQRLFHAAFLSWFQVVRVAFNLLDDVFLLHLALKASQRVF